MTKPILPVLALGEYGSGTLDMFRRLWTHQIATLQPRYQLQYITSKSTARQLLSGGTVRAVLALDHDVAELVKETRFLQAGGTVIFCGPMSGNTGWDQYKVCFGQVGLPWQSSDYYRANFYPGPGASALGLSTSQAYNVKANIIKEVEAGDIVYGPTDRSVSQSMVFAPRNVAQPNAAAAAFASTQGGWVGYVGDVNGEDQTSVIVMAMLQKGTSSAPSVASSGAAAAAAAGSAAAAAESGSEGACRVCGASPGDGVVLKRCSRCRCRTDWYCSRECQRADWDRHKQGCQPAE